MRAVCKRVLGVLTLALVASAPAYAVSPPPQVTSGAINNEQQRQQQQIEQQQPNPQTAPQTAPVVGGSLPPAGAAPAAPGVSFVLKGVTFDHSSFLSDGDLQAISAPYVGKTVTFDNLADIIGKINALYRDKGQVTARAILPPQHIQDGVVHIALVEGKVGKVDVSGTRHMSADYVTDRVDIDMGDTVDSTALTQKVVFFNRTNDAQLKALLKPGAGFGQTDIELSLAEPPPDQLQVYLDNEGVQSTGRQEAEIYYKHNNLFFDGDKSTVYATVSRGGIDGSVAYNVPFDSDSDRLGASYERNHIDIISGQFNGLSIHGSGQTATLGVTRPFIGTEHWLLTGTVSAAYGTSRTDQTTGVVTDTATYRSIVQASLTYISSTLLASVSPSFAYARSHDSILKQNRDIEIFSGQAAAIAPIGHAGTWSFHLTTSWQYSPEKLLPADLLFQIGGPNSVRGYESGTFAGDSGFYANAELHHTFTDIAKGFEMFVFYDGGMVFSTSPSQRSLLATGLGASYSPVDAFTLAATVGVPLEKALPKQDGYQFYLQLSARL